MMKSWQGRRVLITGGLGFVGSNLARRLIDQGAIITLIDSMIPQHGGNLFNIRGIEDKVCVQICDVRSENSMHYHVQGQEFFFNLAGQTCHMDSMENPYLDLDINCRAQISMLEACRKCNPHIKIVFASTRQVYGKPQYLPVDELHQRRPIDANGVNKVAGESYHILYHEVYDIPTCVLRLTNTYGPRMRIKDGRQTFLGVWFRNLIEGKPIEVWDGRQLRDYTYVDDVIDAFLLAALREEANGKIFNLGGDTILSLEQTAQWMVECNGGGQIDIQPFPQERKRIDIGDFYANYDQIRTVLGWQPKISLREGFQRTLEYYRSNLNEYI
jgi:UDP-glucose 4-epimerase